MGKYGFLKINWSILKEDKKVEGLIRKKKVSGSGRDQERKMGQHDFSTTVCIHVWNYQR